MSQRHDALPLVFVPALAAGDAFYARALDTPVWDPTGPNDDDALIARARSVFDDISRAQDAYGAAATTPELAALASGRMADFYDWVAAQLQATGRPDLSGTVCQFFCRAAYFYTAVLSREPGSERATMQLAAYGTDFVAQCAL